MKKILKYEMLPKFQCKNLGFKTAARGRAVKRICVVFGRLRATRDFDPKELFDYGAIEYNSYEEVAQSGKFPYLEQLKNSKAIMTIDLSERKKIKPLQDGNATMPVSHSTGYYLRHDKITGASEGEKDGGIDSVQADSISQEQIWGHPFWDGYPTWCNVYAQYLSSYIYGKIDGVYLVPKGKTANALYEYFNGQPEHYISLKDKGVSSDDIWERYINKGYPVYFSKKEGKHGHIETGFPSNAGVDICNRKVFDAPNSKTSLLKQGDNKFLVGAGGTVGFKSYDAYKEAFTGEAIPFLALRYLANEYE